MIMGQMFGCNNMSLLQEKFW